MIAKICEYCKCEFEAHANKARYCSKQCHNMAMRREAHFFHEAYAARLGVTVEELMKMAKRGEIRFGQPSLRPHRRWKTYKEIQAYNRAHPLQTGWRY